MYEDNASTGFYALIEMMGHQKMVGLVRETKLAGAGFLQVDQLDDNGQLFNTRYLSPGAIYAVNPISEELAKAISKNYQHQPVHSFDLPQLRDKIAQEMGTPVPQVYSDDQCEEDQNEDHPL